MSISIYSFSSCFQFSFTTATMTFFLQIWLAGLKLFSYGISLYVWKYYAEIFLLFALRHSIIPNSYPACGFATCPRFRLHQATALLWIPRPLLLPVLPWERPGGGSRQSAEEVGLQQVLHQQLCPGPAEQDCRRPAVQPQWHQQWPVQEDQSSGGRKGEHRGNSGMRNSALTR